MIKNCSICGKSFNNGEIRDNNGRYLRAGKEICSKECRILRGKKWAKNRREKIHFDSKRDLILERDGHRCSVCGNHNTRLIVHHKDGEGRGKTNPNNDINNLITVCSSCHPRLHFTRHKSFENISFVKDNWELSNRKLAKIIGCSHPTIAIIRKVISSDNVYTSQN